MKYLPALLQMKAAVINDVGRDRSKDVDILKWCSTTALELIGQAGKLPTITPSNPVLIYWMKVLDIHSDSSKAQSRLIVAQSKPYCMYALLS
jgi:hypothetical protein